MHELASSWIELEGAHNVRDLGGLPTAAGLTRHGVLLRSDGLDALTVGDVRLLVDEVGLAQVIDLRAPSERSERAEGRLQAAGITMSPLPVVTDEDIRRRKGDRVQQFQTGEDPAVIMANGYVELVELGGTALSAALRRITADGGSPAIVHCSAGKDRTGVLVALLLDVVGVEREVIVADYAVTQERMGPVVERLRNASAFHELAHRVAAFAYEARPETMRLFLDHLDARWSGGEGYFIAQGVEPATIDAWRALFVG
jgi:protein tyrosine/serine phosphatase